MIHRELEMDLEQQHISHAYLFIGDKEQTMEDAQNFGSALNCLSPIASEPCGSCRNCRLAKNNSFCDFTLLESKKEAYSIEEIRNFNKIAQLTPQEGRYHIFLLKDIDKMDAPAANAMLKTLEEPTKETVLLLLAENGDKILPTILSRCHILQYPLKTALTQEDLDNGFGLLTKLPHVSIDTLFTMTEGYSTKNKEELKKFLWAAEEIIGNSYENCLYPKKGATQILKGEKETLFSLWQKASKALEYLEAKVNPRLIADTFFLAVREKLQ